MKSHSYVRLGFNVPTRKFEIKFLLVLVDTFDVDVSVRINPVDDSLQTDAL